MQLVDDAEPMLIPGDSAATAEDVNTSIDVSNSLSHIGSEFDHLATLLGANDSSNEQDISLDESSPMNHMFLYVQTTTNELLAQLNDLLTPLQDPVIAAQVTNLKEELIQKSNLLINFQLMEWFRQHKASGGSALPNTPIVATEEFFITPHKHNLVSLACILFISFLHLIFHLLCYQVTFVMQALEAILLLFSHQVAHQWGVSTHAADGVVGHIPTALLDAILNNLKISGPTTIDYVCCPTCYKLYKLSLDNVSAKKTCNNVISGATCRARLFSTGSRWGMSTVIPQRRFHYQPIKAWLGRLLSQPEIEELMEQTVKQDVPDSIATDIWHGSFVKLFCSMLGQSFWKGAPELNEGRLLFALAIN
ncbi:hypothetical protein FRB99_005489 [Tulasnella sp. 403]|nr:hypothetical protein FRB99_005489 [Tulasnella sp. 403]